MIFNLKFVLDLDQQQRIFLAPTNEPFKEELGGVSQEEEMEEKHSLSLRLRNGMNAKKNFERNFRKMRRMNHKLRTLVYKKLFRTFIRIALE
jgi:hypothetical protein